MKLSDSVTGLQHIGIPSADLQKSVDFYEALGFTTIYHTVNGDDHVAFLELGGLVLELYGNRSIKRESGAIDHIAAISNEQSESVEQVSESINQISSVVQSNSATAEEGAAASEQLSAEAASLKELVKQFTLASE